MRNDLCVELRLVSGDIMQLFLMKAGYLSLEDTTPRLDFVTCIFWIWLVWLIFHKLPDSKLIVGYFRRNTGGDNIII